MSRSRRTSRWTAAALLAGAVGIGAAGCIAVPVGGGYGEPSVAFPVPGIVIAPPPVVFGGYGHYGGGYRRGYGNRGYGYGSRGSGRWRG